MPNSTAIAIVSTAPPHFIRFLALWNSSCVDCQRVLRQLELDREEKPFDTYVPSLYNASDLATITSKCQNQATIYIAKHATTKQYAQIHHIEQCPVKHNNFGNARQQ
jgi:hypothetical protein